MKPILFLLAVFFISSSPTVSAASFDGHAVRTACTRLINLPSELSGAKMTPDTAMMAGLCTGQIRGIADMGVAFGKICPASSYDVNEMANVVVKYIADNPTSLSKPASVVIYFALEKSYPCANK